MKVQCVIYYGAIQTTGADGESRQEELDTRLGRISARRLTITMA